MGVFDDWYRWWWALQGLFCALNGTKDRYRADFLRRLVKGIFPAWAQSGIRAAMLLGTGRVHVGRHGCAGRAEWMRNLPGMAWSVGPYS